MSKIAIIGTAGRDKTKPMTLALWNWMLAQARKHIPHDAHVVSGGAAWADHVAVELFLSGDVRELTLHLPAPLYNGRFLGPRNSAGNAATYYHELFSQTIGVNTVAQIEQAAQMANVYGSFEPEAEGYAAMFTRNKKVATAESMLAFTFGTGVVPADGGTLHTWNLCKGSKLHIPLPTLA